MKDLLIVVLLAYYFLVAGALATVGWWYPAWLDWRNRRGF